MRLALLSQHNLKVAYLDGTSAWIQNDTPLSSEAIGLSYWSYEGENNWILRVGDIGLYRTDTSGQLSLIWQPRSNISHFRRDSYNWDYFRVYDRIACISDHLLHQYRCSLVGDPDPLKCSMEGFGIKTDWQCMKFIDGHCYASAEKDAIARTNIPIVFLQVSKATRLKKYAGMHQNSFYLYSNPETQIWGRDMRAPHPYSIDIPVPIGETDTARVTDNGFLCITNALGGKEVTIVDLRSTDTFYTLPYIPDTCRCVRILSD